MKKLTTKPKVITTGYDPKTYIGCQMTCLRQAVFRIEPASSKFEEPHLYCCSSHVAKAVRKFPLKPCRVNEIRLTVGRQQEIDKEKRK